MIDPRRRASRLCGYTHSPENGAGGWCCPAADQSGEEVAAWLRDHGLPGEAVVVFFKQQALCQFRLDEIAAWRGRRVHLVEHGAFDAQGFCISGLKRIDLRILKPSTSVALPGMPSGSPGMTGVKQGAFTIYEIGDGPRRVYGTD